MARKNVTTKRAIDATAAWRRGLELSNSHSGNVGNNKGSAGIMHVSDFDDAINHTVFCFVKIKSSRG